ncbi:MAG: hypothetical protein IPJ61_21075 [Tessaracoccus sp.]|uniref:hypothetical protein n=1 Tax=Tessaracoccus sp. TaxID=1971211 RepID=UPI001EB89BC8|nr:hypothetical protein [Tessaracoccus sp.]MBK7823483.1 hypothetical protein [Tessaracoccus sp.]
MSGPRVRVVARRAGSRFETGRDGVLVEAGGATCLLDHGGEERLVRRAGGETADDDRCGRVRGDAVVEVAQGVAVVGEGDVGGVDRQAVDADPAQPLAEGLEPIHP